MTELTVDTTSPSSAILLEIKQGFAIITLNLPHKKNALSLPLFKRLSAVLRHVNTLPASQVGVTIMVGKGDFFSAGADVKAAREGVRESEKGDDNARAVAVRRLSESNMDLAKSLHDHTKILVAACNGPAIGLAGAILGHFDFIYASPSFYLQTPFSSLSLVCEGTASLTFPQRMGMTKAKETLLMGKRLTAEEGVKCGFVNAVLEGGDAFGMKVEELVRGEFEGLDLEAAMLSKQLIKAALPDPDAANLREMFAGADRAATGKPAAEFAKFANKTKRHKL